MRHCAKVGYESLVSVPVRLQQRLIGEIDLFFRSTVQLSAEETELLDALASHLASALEGLRAAALEREAAVGEERTLLARELHEELGLRIDPAAAVYLGQFSAPAANEPGFVVAAEIFLLQIRQDVCPAAEIEEVLWIDPQVEPDVSLAPLTRDLILPFYRHSLKAPA